MALTGSGTQYSWTFCNFGGGARCVGARTQVFRRICSCVPLSRFVNLTSKISYQNLEKRCDSKSTGNKA